jgi:RNA polymerase sigma-70 factor (ECF subfamily)
MNSSLAWTGQQRQDLRVAAEQLQTEYPEERTYCLSEHDRELVAAIQAGDPSAAAPLYDSLRSSIEQALVRVLQDKPAEFEDLMQITYERVIRGITDGKFKGLSQLRTWAYSIALHVAMDWLRSIAQEKKLLDAVDSLDIPTCDMLPERQLEARSEVRRLRGVLCRMKRLNATILVLHDVYDHSVPEVADLLGLNVSAAQSRLRRARQELVRRRTKQVPSTVSASYESISA